MSSLYVRGRPRRNNGAGAYSRVASLRAARRCVPGRLDENAVRSILEAFEIRYLSLPEMPLNAVGESAVPEEMAQDSRS